ncbi:hypothetical protein BVX99_01670 [bacterium F16]|nr:hypothetical protein BVX99_01670 [bacterium F16]
MSTLIAGFIGTTEIWIICIVILVLFGSAAIPKFAKSLGRAKKEFEEGIKDGQKKKEDDDKDEDSDKGTSE